MTGAILSDLVIQELLREVLADIQKNPEVVDELFEIFVSANFQTTKGRREIKEIKQYLKKHKIHIVDGFNLLTTKNLPSYVVYLGGNGELDAEALLDDFGEEAFTDVNGDRISKNSSILDTSDIPDHDGKEEEFVTSIQENVIIDCIAHDPLLTRYLAYLLHYILRFNKNELANRRVNRISLSFSDFQPFQGHDKLPEYLFRRTCTVRCQTFMTSVTNVSNQLLTAINAQVIAEDSGTTDQGNLETDIIVTREKD